MIGRAKVGTSLIGGELLRRYHPSKRTSIMMSRTEITVDTRVLGPFIKLKDLFEEPSAPTHDELTLFEIEYGFEYPDQGVLDNFYKKGGRLSEEFVVL